MTEQSTPTPTGPIHDLMAELANELDHAYFNEHFLSADSQGVGPGERVPAVRAQYIEAILKRAGWKR